MAQLHTVKATDLTPDGRLRRKYEDEQREEPKTGLQASAAFLIANAFIAMKNILFGDTAADQAATAQIAPDKTEAKMRDEAAGAGVATFDDDEKAEPQDQKVPGPLAFESLDALSGSRFSFSDSGYAEVILSPPAHGLAALLPLALRNALPSPADGPANTATVIPFHGGANSGQDAGGRRARARADREDETDGEGDRPVRPPSGINRLPVVTGPVLLNDILINQSIIIALNDLLRDAHDPDGDDLQVQNLAASTGTLIYNGNGTWAFTPGAYLTGDVTFNYDISDGHGSSSQVAELDVLALVGEDYEGTDEADTVIGSPGSDRITTRDGDDVILAREGDDVIDSGGGADRIIGGQGNDIIFGGDGDDIILAGDGDDVVFGGGGNDVILGESGDDVLHGESGNDQIFGGEGNDRLLGGEGDDLLSGGAGDDLVVGGSGQDQLDGGEGADILIAGAGDDLASGGGGDDSFVATLGDGDDSYDGGEGADSYSIAATSANAVIDLVTGIASSDDIGSDQLTSIENATGGSGNDQIITSCPASVVAGGAGNDTFVFQVEDVGSSGHGSGQNYMITDFEPGDVIDFSSIQGNLEADGWQRLTFVYDEAEFDGVGKINYHYNSGDEQETTVIEVKLWVDVDGDDKPDMVIELIGHHELNQDNVWT